MIYLLTLLKCVAVEMSVSKSVKEFLNIHWFQERFHFTASIYILLILTREDLVVKFVVYRFLVWLCQIQIFALVVIEFTTSIVKLLLTIVFSETLLCFTYYSNYHST